MLSIGIDEWLLRAWQPSDALSLAQHANNIKVWRNMADTFPHPYTLECAQQWVSTGHVDFGGDNWAIDHQDQAVGGCGVHQERGQFRCNVEIGYWLAEQYWGQGVVTQVVRVLTDYAFALPEVTRVYAPVHAYNAASMRVLEKNGFTREALLRKSAFKAGQVIDRVVWSKIKEF